MKKFTLLLFLVPFLQGNAQNPMLLKDIGQGTAGSRTSEIVPTASGYTFFNADDDGDNISGLWRTNGTPGSTQKLDLKAPGFITMGASMLTPLGNKKIFFAGDNGFGYGEAWVSDGTQGGTIALEGVFPASPNITFAPVMGAAPLGSNVIYATYTNDNHIVLKKTNGTIAGTSVLYDFGGGKKNNMIAVMKNVGNLVYFDYFDADNTGTDFIMATDGVSTFLVSNLSTIPGAASPYFLTSGFMPTNNGVYFLAQNNTGVSLFKMSGSGTLITAEIVKTFNAPSNLYPSFAAIDNTLYFAFNDGPDGKELWKSDGTETGTVMISDINPGPNSSNPLNLTVMNNTLYFTALYDLNGDGQAKETALLSCDGSFVTPRVMVSQNSTAVSNIAVCNNTLLMAVTGANGAELWVSDGASALAQVADINPGAIGSNPSLLTTAGNNVYFRASTATRGQEIYKYSAPDKIWTGFASANWGDAGNWIPAGAPAATDNALIGTSGTALNIEDVVFCNNLTVNGTLTSSGAIVFVNGDFYNTGDINLNGGIFVISSSTQTDHKFGSTTPITGNVVSQLNTNITLSENTVINGYLRFETPTRHNFWLGNYDFTVNQIDFVTDSSFITTNGTGKLSVINNGNATTVFPVGASTTSYTPITVTNDGVTDVFSVRVAEGVLQGGTGGDTVKQQNVNRTWYLSEAVAGGSNVTLTAQWNAENETPLFDRQTVFLNHYTGGTWDAGTSGVAQGTGPYSFSRSGITSFSPFAVSSAANILPVNIAAFTATKRNMEVLLDWKTATEQNSAYFNVQRSADGTNFSNINVQQAAGSSNAVKSYTYTDNIAKQYSTIYYRIQEVDKDGKATLSAVRAINTGNIGLSFYPNPAKTSVKITGSNIANVQVYDVQGKLVISHNAANAGNTTLNISALSKGTYMVVAKDATGNTQLQKLVVE